MNNKEQELHRIAEAVVKCCSGEENDVTLEAVVGASRAENLVMTRAIMARQVVSAGYSVATASRLLKRSERAVRHLLALDIDYMTTSRAYRIASAEATLACRDISRT